MNLEAQKKLQALFDAGYQIRISSHYVDSFVRGIREDDSGVTCYDSSVYSDRPLAEVSLADVDVYRRVDNWQEVKLEDKS